MGFEVIRFANSNEVNQDLICIICKGVLEDPVWAYHCEHAFCKACINKWLIRRSICPNDRQHLQQSHLKPIPRFMRNLLDKLDIKCDFESLGCNEVVKLESLRQHTSDCDFNPEKRIECQSGCGLIIKKADISSHNCVKDLRKTVNTLIEENLKNDRILTSARYDINLLRNENNKLNELTNKLQNDIKHIKQLVGIKDQLVSETTPTTCVAGSQTTTTSMTTSTSVKILERNCRLVPNPYVLITPLQSSLLSNETVLNTSDEPSSSTLTNSLNSRLDSEEPAFKRRATTIRPMPTLRRLNSPSLRLIRSYSPPSVYSSPLPSPRFVPNLPTLSPSNESQDEETGTTITIGGFNENYDYISLDTEQEIRNIDLDETDDENASVVDQTQDEYDIDANTNEDNV